MDEYRPQFDEHRFRDLVLYIGQRARDDPARGKARLYTTLWLSDFLAYARLGRSITGADYVHMPQGPGPDGGEALLREMQGDGSLLPRTGPRFAHAARRPLARRQPEPDPAFTPPEIAIVEEALRRVEGQSAAGTSEWAHAHSVGWRLTEDGERIPYETVFLSPEEPTADDDRWARKVAEERRGG